MRPAAVIVNGRLVAENGKALFLNTDEIPKFALESIHIDPSFLEPSTYHVFPGEGRTDAWVQAMEMYDGYFKRAFHTQLSARSPNGPLQCDAQRDVLKVVVVDRHHATQNLGIGFVRGFGLRRGAIACTTNCENQNLVVIGTSDAEIASAVQSIIAVGGGFVAVLGGEMIGSVKLDVAGCMSSDPWEKVRDESLALDAAVKSFLGCSSKAPFMIASFVGLVGVPDLGLTEKGLIDCKTQSLMNVVLSEQDAGMESVPTERAVKICCRCPSHAHDVHRMMDRNTTVVA